MGQSKFYKPVLGLLIVAMLVVVSFIQKDLNRDREQLGLTRVTVLENAPPVLAFTTVALGGFRGLIANALWVRAMDMQEAGKYFEMVQLADWIAKLQPYFVSSWVVQGWNMAYNISIKFSEPKDRWHWVQRGIELIRDEGLKYNPRETLLYRELAWFFQHKLGQNLDDAHLYYKQAWSEQVETVIPGGKPNWDELLNPKTTEAKARAELLKTKFKMDARKMKEVDELYGPFEWRLPESHSVYWGYIGLQYSKREELITLRRNIYQSMQTAFHRGRLIENKNLNTVEMGPNLEIIPNANKAYEDMMRDDPEMRDHMSIGHRNFLKDAVYFLYVHNRRTAAEQWYKYLKDKYPLARLDKPSVELKELTLDEYAVARVMEEVGDTSNDKTKSALLGILTNAYLSLVSGDDDQYTGLVLLAQKIWNRFQSKIGGSEGRVGLPPLEVIKQEVLENLFDEKDGIGPEASAVLRTRLNLPPPTPVEPAPTTQPAQPAEKP